MGRKEKDFIMCKIYKDVACCGCGECLITKKEEYKYNKNDVWNVWMNEDERPKLIRHENGKMVIKEVK